ncbi:hypothetical protein BDF21DRAFT_401438 [Thamnidium elegans]|nr:hypothetical protein BDF21DRAFT_401438 [Thamnidium elegans]
MSWYNMFLYRHHNAGLKYPLLALYSLCSLICAAVSGSIEDKRCNIRWALIKRHQAFFDRFSLDLDLDLKSGIRVLFRLAICLRYNKAAVNRLLQTLQQKVLRSIMGVSLILWE